MWKIDREKHGPAALLAIFSIALVAPLIFAGKTYLFRDFGRFYYPVKQYYVDRVLAGGFPLWSPEMSCGTPLHGELVHAFLYPLNAFLFLGPAPGWGLYFAAHLLLAGLGARRLAMKFGAAPDAALAAGFAFAGSGYLISQINHVPYASTAAWAPLIVSLILDLKDRRRFTVPLLSIGFAMAALAGEPFTLLLTIFFSVVVILGGFAGPRIPAFLRTGAAGAIAVLIATPALLPAYQQLGESIRAGGWEPDEAGFGSLHPIRFTTVFAPEAMGRLQHAIDRPVPFFGARIDIVPPILLGIHLGALTLVTLFLAPLRAVRAARWLLPVIVVAGLLSLGPHLGLATWLSKNVPGLGSFRYPDKYWFVVTLAAAPLLALALPRLRTTPAVAVSCVLAAVAFLLGLATKQPSGAVTGALAFGLVAAAFRVPEKHRTKALTAVLALELFFFGARHNIVTDPVNLGPMHPRGLGTALERDRPGRLFVDFDFPREQLEKQVEEITLFQLQQMEPMAGLPAGFSYSIGYDPIEPLGRVPKFFKMPGEMTPAQRTQMWHRLLRLSSTTHAITNKDLRGDREVTLLRHLRRPAGVRVLTYVRSAPRARLYGDVVFVPDMDTGRDRIQTPAFDPFRVLVIEGEGQAELRGVPRGSVRFLADEPHRVRLKVNSDRPAWLFLGDAFADGWTAEVDEESERIHVGMVAFRAVRVPEGESVVEFRYEPGWLGIVPITAGAGLLILALLFVLGRRGERRISVSDPGSGRTSGADGR
jgi:hypothetical protein